MDINKLSTHLNGTQAAGQKAQTSGVSAVGEAQKSTADKVTLDGYQFKKNELLFAKTELDKQSSIAFDNVRAVKAQLNEFEQAKAESPEKAASTEMGQKLNDPAVWESIAQKILGS